MFYTRLDAMEAELRAEEKGNTEENGDEDDDGTTCELLSRKLSQHDEGEESVMSQILDRAHYLGLSDLNETISRGEITSQEVLYYIYSHSQSFDLLYLFFFFFFFNFHTCELDF